ncbi:MAG: hypothetical protein WBC18_11900 [Ottowia sp.]|uniref:hypothetical protein n=1 Tax=unclassified Ottowia TaxID=2645081 RepID=UPI003C2C62E7
MTKGLGIGTKVRERCFTVMLAHVESPDVSDTDTALATACPEAAALVRALNGCCHPRAGRLLARLGDCEGADQIDSLRAEVFNLLALSFGPTEAQRRLLPLQ